jgi:predicted kinase
MIKEGDEYFSKENDVFAKWIKDINTAIKNENITNIYADATHISEASRNKTLLHLDLKNVNIIPIVMTTDPDECVRRNEMRIGMECVPAAVIYRMSSRLRNEPVNKDLGWKYKEIIYV